MLCRVLKLSRSSFYYKSKTGNFEKRLLKRLHYLSTQYPRYGYRRLHALLRREGWQVNKKRIQRLMRQEGLRVLIAGKKRRRLGISTSERKKAEYRNHVWTWDFIFDRLEDGRSLKMLVIVDEYTRESLSIYVNRNIKSLDVIDVLRSLIKERGVPSYIRSDNGPEFIAKAIERWLKFYQVDTIYIKPGSPWENAYIESFNGKFRDECLNMELFSSMTEARVIIEDWRREYNEIRPHSSLGYLTPVEFSKNSELSFATLNQAQSSIRVNRNTNFKNCTENGVRSPDEHQL
jgi:transposase InsO family protein